MSPTIHEAGPGSEKVALVNVAGSILLFTLSAFLLTLIMPNAPDIESVAFLFR
jgi:hypothetical protein